METNNFRRATASFLTALLLSIGTSTSVLAIPFDIPGPGASNIDSSTNPVDVSLVSVTPGVITDLNIQFVVSNPAFFIHPEDWSATLIHGTTSVLLKAAAIGAHTVFGSSWNVTWDDEAPGPLTPAQSFVDGSYTPVQALSAFDGQNLIGIWTLRFEDDVFPNNGDALVSWRIFGEIAGAVPEPNSLALIGACLAALAFARRRKT